MCGSGVQLEIGLGQHCKSSPFSVVPFAHAKAVLPLTLGTGIVRLKVVDAREAKSRADHAPSVRIANEAVNQLQTVKALAAEQVIYDEYHSTLVRSSSQTISRGFLSTVLFALAQTNMYFVIALGFWYGSRLVYSGEISPRAFFAVFVSTVSLTTTT